MPPAPAPRFRPIDRHAFSPACLDQQLPPDDPARLLWDFVGQLDLRPFTKPAKAVEGRPGNPIVPPQLLFALWLLATIEGLHSARELAARTTRDLPYQWLCGGRPISHHTLADFYADHAAALRDLFVEHIAALRQQGLITLHEVTVDGRKVIANASKDTYRREGTLQRHLAEAEDHLAHLQRQRDQAERLSAGQAAARRRAARERVARLRAALTVVRQRQEQRRETNRQSLPPDDARANETDPDCAKMKMPDGGYRPAYNVETVVDTRHGLIVTVAVTNQGSDNGQLGPLRDRVEAEQGQTPRVMLADSGFVDQEDIERLETTGTTVVMPPKNEKQEAAAGRDPYARKRRDSEAVAGWRGRMGQAASRAAYRRRAPVAEGVHAQEANRGWRRFRLRGLAKVGAEALWASLAHNIGWLIRHGRELALAVRAE